MKFSPNRTELAAEPAPEFTPIKRASVNEAVYQAIRNKLIHGEYGAGQTLGIQALADALGTSTMPVREALRRLVAQQGLEPLPNGTTRVPLITADRLMDLRRNRVLIEGAALQWAAPHLTSMQLDALDALAEHITTAQRSAQSVLQGLEHNLAFHFTIYQAAQSPVQLAMIESLWLQSGPYLRATRALLHTQEHAQQGLHERIVMALRAGDNATARTHLEADICWSFDCIQTSMR